MRSLALLAAAAVLAAGCTSLVVPGPEAATFSGLVVAAHPLAADAGAAMLRAGGSAADAAAAVQWALTVVEPQFSGIGGGAFLLVRDGATGATTLLDGRERAPAATTPDQFQLPGGLGEPPGDPTTQGYAVGVPGTVKVLAELHARAGRLPWARTFEPAVALAEEGFAVDPDLARHLREHEARLRSWPASGRIYLEGAACPPDVLGVSPPTGCVGGAPWRAGATLRNPDLAATLRTLATEGPDAFYRGPIAETIVLTAQQRQGRMTAEDLAAYEVVEREPARGRYRGHEVVTAPSPGGGPILLEMLNILEGFPLRDQGAEDAATLHQLIEAMRLAYADRARYNADPDVVRVPQRGLAHPAYGAERRSLIEPDRRLGEVAAGDPWAYEDAAPRDAAPAAPERGAQASHTSHFVVIDREGTIVSATTTIEYYWGTGMTVPGHGFLLNNELTDFDRAPGGANEPGPFKRPRSSMVPTIVLRDGVPVLALGAAGGPTITTSVLQVLLRVVEHSEGVRAAVAAPRVFGPWDAVEHEPGLPGEALEGLAARGHPLEGVGSISRLQAAAFEQGRWVGAPDPRHEHGGGLAEV